MGSPKPLVRLRDGRTFLEALADSLRHGGVAGRIFVVTGSRRARVAAEAKRLGLTPVHNIHHADGQLSSALTGLRAALRAKATPLLLLPCDMPHLVSATVARLLSVDPPALPVRNGRPGHPIYLDAPAARALLDQGGARDLRQALRSAGVRARWVAVVDRAIHENVNTPAQLKRWEGFSSPDPLSLFNRRSATMRRARSRVGTANE
jgi:CTP:molybdopterin cytidylyltransferase MocA